MNIIYLSPDFPANGTEFCQALRQKGFNVLGIGDRLTAELPSELRLSLNEYYQVDSLFNYPQIIKAVGYLIHRWGKINRLISQTSICTQVEAALRTDFNIEGIKQPDLTDYYYKSCIKNRFRSAGIEVAPGRMVYTVDDAADFIVTHGYPVVIKTDGPDFHNLARKLSSPEELQRFFAVNPENRFFIEKYISGRLFSFDGLTDSTGTPVFSTALWYCDALGDVEGAQERSGYFYTLREIPMDLVSVGVRLLQQYQINSRFFHLQFIRSERDNLLYPFKLSLYPPAGFLVDMFNYSADIDLYQLQAAALAGEVIENNYQRRYFCCYVGRRKHLPYRYGQAEISRQLKSVICRVIKVSTHFGVESGYILRSPHLSEIHSAVRLIQQLL